MASNQDVACDVRCFPASSKYRFHSLLSFLLWYQAQGPQVLRNEHQCNRCPSRTGEREPKDMERRLAGWLFF